MNDAAVRHYLQVNGKASSSNLHEALAPEAFEGMAPVLIGQYTHSNIAQAVQFCNEAVAKMVKAGYTWDEGACDVYTLCGELNDGMLHLESTVNALGMHFGFITSEGVLIDEIFKGGDARSKVYLRTLGMYVQLAREVLEHPAVALLSKLQGISDNVYPFGHLRGMRYSYNHKHKNTLMTQEPAYFLELGKLIVKIGTDFYNSARARGRGSPLLDSAYMDFVRYVYDDTRKEILVNQLSLGNALLLLSSLTDIPFADRRI